MKTGVTLSKSLPCVDFEMCSNTKEFWARLIAWGSNNLRSFPWRESTDPFAVLASEAILRKTGATKAQKTFVVFMKKWPSFQALASDAPEAVCEFFRPLGLPRRGFLIWEAARKIAEEFGGIFPRDRGDLMRLPGVGRYTADAILCFAFGVRALPLDAGGARTVQRALGRLSKSKRPWTDASLNNFLLEALPKGLEKEAAFALIDFSNLVCKSRNPLCKRCPLIEICAFAGDCCPFYQ